MQSLPLAVSAPYQLLFVLTRACVATAAVATAVAGSLALLGGLYAPLDALANGAPILLGWAIIVLVPALLCCSSGVVQATALVGVLAPAGLVAPEIVATVLTNRSLEARAPQLKLLAANVWSSNHDRAAMEALVAREEPDIIVLVEAWRWRHELSELATDYRVVAGCAPGHDCDVVILSKLTPIGVVDSAPGSFASVRLELPHRLGGGVIEVMGVHLSRPPPFDVHRAQAIGIAAAARGFGDRALIAGDLNATPWSSTLRQLDRALRLQRRTRALFSWPTSEASFTQRDIRSPFALFPIDHIYAGEAWQVIEIRRGPNIGSDHYPVIATFVLREHADYRSSPTGPSLRRDIRGGWLDGAANLVSWRSAATAPNGIGCVRSGECTWHRVDRQRLELG